MQAVGMLETLGSRIRVVRSSCYRDDQTSADTSIANEATGILLPLSSAGHILFISSFLQAP
jgi:hypothetical protein